METGKLHFNPIKKKLDQGVYQCVAQHRISEENIFSNPFRFKFKSMWCLRKCFFTFLFLI